MEQLKALDNQRGRASFFSGARLFFDRPILVEVPKRSLTFLLLTASSFGNSSENRTNVVTICMYMPTLKGAELLLNGLSLRTVT